MLQHLINTSAIWVTSLLLFDIFLRRESFHTYNRWYLLMTFILGLLLPFWQWQRVDFVQEQFQTPLQKVIHTKAQIASTITPEFTTNWQAVLWMIYCLGATISVVVLFNDIVQLVKYHRSGSKSTSGNWTIIETGRGHAPFSLLNTLYVHSVNQYEQEEWDMLLTHEKQHYTLFHFADVLLFELAKIVLWFHPLVHIYNKRLLMVHEFQADSLSEKQPQQYGQFLIEQALLGGAPQVTHSFNRSPIKNRIIMLTKHSTRAAKSKMLVLIPLLLVSAYCFAQYKTGSKFINDHGKVRLASAKLEFSTNPDVDTITLLDPVNGKEEMKIVKHDPWPVNLDGDAIYDKDNVTTGPTLSGQQKSIRNYIFNGIKSELLKLPAGIYYLSINNLIVNKKGQLCYFEYFGISPDNNHGAPVERLTEDMQKKVGEKTIGVLESCPLFQPATKGNKKLNATIQLNSPSFKIEQNRLYIMVDNVWMDLQS